MGDPRGGIDLKIPKLRQGSYYPAFLEPRCAAEKAREAGRIVSVAVMTAVGVNRDDRREVLGMATGPSEAETFWMAEQFEFFVGSLRDLVPEDHILRQVHRVLDLSWNRSDVRDLYSAGNGRPSIGPEAALW